MAVYTVGSNQDVVVAADDDTYDVTGSNNTFEVGTYNTLIFYLESAEFSTLLRLVTCAHSRRAKVR